MPSIVFYHYLFLILLIISIYFVYIFIYSYGGALAYTRPPPVLTPPFTIQSSTFHPSTTSNLTPIEDMPPLRILITNTYVPKETSKLVGGVRILRDTYPSIIDGILVSVNGIATQVLSILQDHAKHLKHIQHNTSITEDVRTTELNQLNYITYNKLTKCLSINQFLLNSIGVGHPVLDKVVNLASQYGFTAKLTGAGGGGCAITLLPFQNLPGQSTDTVVTTEIETLEQQISTLQQEYKNQGWDCFETQLGGTGVLVTQ